MANSIEGREPMLDHDLLEFSLKYGRKHNYYNKSLKFPLKDILSDFIPKKLFDRPKKGFGIPLDSIMRNDMKNKVIDTINSSTFLDSYIEKKKIIKEMNLFYSNSSYNTTKMYYLFNLYNWALINE